MEKRRGRSPSGPSQSAVDVQKLNKEIWRLKHSRIWLTKRILATWRELKGLGLFANDSDFAGHLLSLEMKRRERMKKKGENIVKLRRNKETKPSRAEEPKEFLSSTPQVARSKRSLFTESETASFSPSPIKVVQLQDRSDISMVDITGSSIGTCTTSEDCTVVNGSVLIEKDATFQSDHTDTSDEDQRPDSEDNDNESGSNLHSFENFLSLLDDEAGSEKGTPSTSDSESQDEAEADRDDVYEDEGDPTCEDDLQEEAEVQTSYIELPYGPGRQFSRHEDAYKLIEELKMVNDMKVVVSISKIEQLFKMCREPGCCEVITTKSSITGSTLEIWWTCNKNHSGKWASSDKYCGMYVNNLQFCSSILLSGNNQAKVKLMCQFLNLCCPSKASFFRCQKFYIIPAVEEWWKWMSGDILELIKDEEVIASGDGQSDSPGHSAKYLTYFLMLSGQEEYIIHIECLDKREVGGKSPNMEREALKRAINYLKNVINLKEVVTDASSSGIKMMADEYKEIIHSLDVWHKAKNIRKCITQVGRLKDNQKIGQWANHIINHFWFCCASCDGQESKLKTLWMSLLYHVCDQHEWTDGKCIHEQTSEATHNLPWFDRRDKDFHALQEIVINPRLLATLKYYVNFRHTGMLEAVNSHSLMYAPKRCAFGMKSFRARKMLAAIDHNYHLHRTSQQDELGEVRCSRKYNQRTKHWEVIVLKKEKDYSYVSMMMAKVFEMRKVDKGNMQDYMEMSIHDARHIAPTIAQVAPLPTQQLKEMHKSRYSKSS